MAGKFLTRDAIIEVGEAAAALTAAKHARRAVERFCKANAARKRRRDRSVEQPPS